MRRKKSRRRSGFRPACRCALCLRRSEGGVRSGGACRALASPPGVRPLARRPRAVLLVDDVVTPARRCACASASCSAGCGGVVALTFAWSR